MTRAPALPVAPLRLLVAAAALLAVAALAPAAAPAAATGDAAARDPVLTDALRLPAVERWVGPSARHAPLGRAAYAFSKWWRQPRMVAVACWSSRDWSYVSIDPDFEFLLGFWTPRLPRWLHLAPRTCSAVETLLSKRPRYPNAITAGALGTVTHELLHALGLRNEPLTECVALQTMHALAHELGLPRRYAAGLSRLQLGAWRDVTAGYRDVRRCREGGTWDLEPERPSPPWHHPGF